MNRILGGPGQRLGDMCERLVITAPSDRDPGCGTRCVARLKHSVRLISTGVF